MLADTQLSKLRNVLNNGMEFTMWGIPPKNSNFLTSHGAYGAAIFDPVEEGPPESSEDAVYGNSPEEAIEKALERWGW